MDKIKLKQAKAKYFEIPESGDGLSYRDKFVQQEDLENRRDYWVIVNEREEVVSLSASKKGVTDEVELLQSRVDIDDNDDYYCYKVTHAEYVELLLRMEKAQNESRPTSSLDPEPNLNEYRHIVDKDCLAKRELKGHICKKLGANYLKCSKLNRIQQPLGVSETESRQEQPEIVGMGLANIVTISRASFEVGAHVEVSFKGTFARPLGGRKVHIVRIAIDERAGEYMKKILNTYKVPEDFTGGFELFAKDRVERIDQIYQIILESEIEGGTSLGICEKLLLVEEVDTSQPVKLVKGYYNK